MKRLLALSLVLLANLQVSAAACPTGQAYQCIAANPPALGEFCGCAASNVKSIGVIPFSPNRNEPWNSCLTCQ